MTFVLADVEGSVQLWQHEHEAMAFATAGLDELVSSLAVAHHGARPVEQGEGDSFVAAFPLAGDAVRFVLAVQRTLHTAPWATALPLRLRIGVHTGTSELRNGHNYMGPAISRCARLRALAHGGQILLSGATAELVLDELGDGVTLLDLGLQPLRGFDRPEHVYQLCAVDLPVEFPPLRGEANPAHRLPTALTTFVARTDEMSSLEALLQEARLVTLTGAGGSGKTRLALECARRLVPRFGGGVAWADVAPIADPALVTSCAAAALDVREVAGEPLLDTLVREIGDRELLLVFDNCEHVIDEAAGVIDRLVRDCVGLRVVATSREPLGVPGEVAMRVPSLNDAAAAQLFLDRARAVRSDFDLTETSREAVTAICARLDGIPLAIELAAARVRVLTPQQIADGLADRFRLLTGGGRTSLPRQRTLEASVDWSYRLLDERERRLLRRLSVFAGTFTLESAQQVCGDDDFDASSILDALTTLADKSLIQASGEVAHNEARYRMLETIRHFARQRLADTPEAVAVRDRHLAHFLTLAEQVGPRIERGNEREWLDRLDRDLDNVRAALEWAEQSGAAELLLRMMAASWLFWEVRCRFEEGCRWLRTAVDATSEPSLARAMALYGLGDMSIFTRDLPMVAVAGTEVVAIGERLGDPRIVARGSTLLGWAGTFGVHRDARWAVEELAGVLRQLCEADDPWLHCDINIARGFACANVGDVRSATAAWDEAVASAQRSGTVGGQQRARYFRGWGHVLCGDARAGLRDLEHAIELSGEIDDTFLLGLSLGVAGFARLLAGDERGAEADATEALALGERYHEPWAIGIACLTYGMTLVWRGDHVEAQPVLERALPLVEVVAPMAAWTEAAAALSAAGKGDLPSARSRLEAALERAVGLLYARGTLGLARGWIERIAEDDAAAESFLTEAVAALAEGGARGLTAAALEQLAVSAARRNQFDRAARLFAAAEAERRRLGVPPMRWPAVPGVEAEFEATATALGASCFSEATAAGGAMTLDEAVRFARRGKGGRRRPGSGWASLTPTEIDVARLVAAGLTNRGIAERLVVTSGTVKIHLSHIFSKIGVTSRAELAAEAVRRGLAPDDGA